jgi:vacuolar-type H+-ATPase subunit H
MAFLSFFMGNRIGQIIGIVVLLSGSFFTWLAIHDHNLWNEATDKFNMMQQELFNKKEEEFKQKTGEINSNADRIREIIAQQEATAKKQLEEIEKKADEETKPKTPAATPVSDDASPYLKSIVKQLDAVYGEKKK